uniref:Polypeptide N-acetylgalactosaminyltransferase n=1 Tax=Nyssomyia neivai TaxID=330878 RepID=A0A1L8E225_9DIPT
MRIRGSPFGRSLYQKLLLITIVVVSFIFYFKFIKFSTEQLSPSPESNLLDFNDVNSLSPFEKLIRADLLKQERSLGDRGKPVSLIGASKRKGEEDLKRIALNEELSEHLSYNRTVPDARNPLCRNKHYDLDNMLTASVIIIFYNEPYSVLVRTVQSVLNTGDPRILKEIILVDDASVNAELKDKLDYYIETRFPKNVRLIRLTSRLGLIRARLAGARVARGEVLVFLDAHCECVEKWLEPLLERIKESRTSVLVPIIDVIDAKDFHYSSNGYSTFQVGGFSWNGHFDWIDISSRERERQKRECRDKDVDVCPTYSPTMAGGLFAINREYFWEIGSYDEQMDGWGGENLEISFRVWQCGGTIETIPCSRVGHIFRDFHPYSFPDNRDTHGINTVRMALVWMDEYISLFFMNRPDLKNHPEVGDVTHRKILRDKMRCKSFDWYLKNVFPEKFIPTKGVQAYGRIKSLTSNTCLDDLQQDRESPFNLGIYGCHGPLTSHSQFFSLTRDGVLRVEEACASVQESKSTRMFVVMSSCNKYNSVNNRWELTAAKQLRYVKLNLCLDMRDLKEMDYIYVAACDPDSDSQLWDITH